MYDAQIWEQQTCKYAEVTLNRFLTFVGIKHCTRAHGFIGVTANSNFSNFKEKTTVYPGVTITVLAKQGLIWLRL